MIKKWPILMFLVVASSLLSFKLMPEAATSNAVRNESCRKAFYYTSYGKVPFGTVLVKNKVQNSEVIGSIFSKYNISSNKAYEISLLPDSIFDERRVKAGNKYAVLYERIGQEFSPKEFIYEKNKVDYVVFGLSNEVTVRVDQKPIDYVDKITSGLITSSLYETLLNDGANPLLAVELAEIYKWTIDFYRIQNTDFFKAIYVEQFVEGESIGAFDIKGCVFQHFGKDNYAFLFSEDATGIKYNDYYDEEGQSMQRKFLQAPVKYSRISSKYTMNRYHPVTGGNKPHLGTDYAAASGTPIYATANGIITKAEYKKYNGNYVKIKHDKVYTTQYLHMSKIASGIKKGVYVEQGQVIGYVGQTGLATGPHVCYRFWKNGKQVDPYKEVLPKAKNIEEESLPDFMEMMLPLKSTLDSVELLPS